MGQAIPPVPERRLGSTMRAVIYSRVSSQEQLANLSLPTQEKYRREYCQRQGYTVDTVFVERGESAKSVERPVFREMVAGSARTRLMPSSYLP